LKWGGFAGTNMHAHTMLLFGMIMMALFGHLFFAPFKRFKAAVAAGDPPAAARHIGQIRLFVAINLVLGLLVSVIGASGCYWG